MFKKGKVNCKQGKGEKNGRKECKKGTGKEKPLSVRDNVIAHYIGLFSEQNSIYYHILYFLFHPSLLLLYFDEKVVRCFIYYNTKILILVVYSVFFSLPDQYYYLRTIFLSITV